jgi:hypothetical protein
LGGSCLPFDSEPKTHGVFDFGKLLGPKGSEAAKKLRVRNRDDSLSVERTRFEERDR